MVQPHDVVDVTTTSVGRRTLIDTYESFLAQTGFAGRFRFLVTIDPAYHVAADELAETRAFLSGLSDHPRVAEVVVEEFDHRVGLAAALSVLIAHARTPVGMHLEDDWRIVDRIDLDGLIADLADQRSTQICLANSHVERGGTFDRPGETEHLSNTRVPLLRFTAASWAAPYMAMCPHVHDTLRWAPTVARALALSDPLRCPDERIKEYLIREDLIASHNVLWTRQVLARDLGREWLVQRGLLKSVHPAHEPGLPAARLPATRHTEAAVSRSGAMAATIHRTLPAHDGNLVFDRGEGAIVWDVDGRDYVDLDSAGGTLSLGHNHPAVTNTIRERVAKGVRLPGMSASEVAVAQLLVGTVLGAEAAHFTCTAADARRAAVALAQRATGRDDILYVGDDTPDGEAVRAVEAQPARWAAVLLQPPLLHPSRTEWIQELRRGCDDTGTLLVYDESVTAFRLGPGGFGSLHNVAADLTCLPTTAAAGMPLAALVGRHDLMRHLPEVPEVRRLPGPDVLSVEVAKFTLREYGHGRYAAHVATLGARLRDDVNDRATRRVVQGYDALPTLDLTGDALARFRAEMAERSVLVGGATLFLGAAHTPEQVQFAADAVAASLAAIR